VSPFNRQIGLPAGVAVILAGAAFGVNQAIGPQPVAWLFKYGTVLFYVPWLISLVLISAAAAYWAQRSGASVRGRFLVAASPGIVIGGVYTVLALLVVLAASASGHRVHPLDAVGHFLIGWLLVPGVLGMVGALPFLRNGDNLTERGGRTRG
jgi:hypothetical protein